VSLPDVPQEYLPAIRTVSRHHPPFHPASSGSAPARDRNSAAIGVPSARRARTASSPRSVRQTVRSVPRRSESVTEPRATSVPVPVLSVRSGRGAAASRLSHESGHSDVNRGPLGTAPVAPGERPKSPDAAITRAQTAGCHGTHVRRARYRRGFESVIEPSVQQPLDSSVVNAIVP